MPTREPIAEGEWYHCFNRGVNKCKVFESSADYKRFLVLLYICNGTEPIHASDISAWQTGAVFVDTDLFKRRGRQLVDIGAYALMPNHFHILIREKEKGGLGLFMQKVFTGYTMFFNKKHERTGSLFAGSFKTKHILDDVYLKQVISYIHLNPAEIADGGWKVGKSDRAKVHKFLSSYPYSSLGFFLSRFNLDRKNPSLPAGKSHVGWSDAQAIVSREIFDNFEYMPSLEEMLLEAEEYYLENFVKV